MTLTLDRSATVADRQQKWHSREVRIKWLFTRKKKSSRSIRRLYVLAVTLPVLAVLLPITFLSLQRANSSQAAWFDSNWQYRKRVNIPTHTSLESNVYVTVPTFDATDATKFQADCGDLRFTKETGQLLKFYVVDCDSTANIHVFFESLPAGETNYYMYYGNVNAINGFETADFSTAATGLGTLALASEETAPGPSASWGFNEGSINTCSGGTNDACDSTRNGADGAFSATPPTYADPSSCVSGTCLFFSGNSDRTVSVPDNKVLDVGTASFTVQAWIRKGDTTSQDFILHRYLDEAGFALMMQNTGALRFAIDDDASSFPDDSAISPLFYDDNQWHFVVGVKTGTSSIKLYVDGKEVATDTSVNATGTLSSNDPLIIGANGDGATQEWENGYIDEVRMYPYARTAAQIQTDYSMSAASIGGVNQSALSSGLIGYWKLDETSGNPVDSSGNAQTLTNANTTAYAIGKFANGADLERSSTNYFYVADNATLSVTGNLTLAAWIKPESVTAATTFTILGKWDGANESYRLTQFGDEISLAIDASSFSVTSPASNLATGNWYHVAGTFDPGSRRMAVYINGDLVAESVAGPTSIGDTTEVFQLGGANHTASGTDLYDGVIDDARVYNRTLSKQDIENLYQFGPAPVGSWSLNEGTGTTAFDQSTNGNDLTLTNSPAWRNGKFGGGITFAGSDQQLLRADDSDFDFVDDADMSISLFFKHTTASAQEIILSKFNEAGYKVIMESDGDITCAMDYDSTWTPTDSATSTAATYDDNQWHHIECVKSGATSMKLFIDGVYIAVDSSLTATNTLTNSDPLYIGINADGTSNDFTGSLDEIKIYNYARTPTQVQSDKNAGHSLGSADTPNVYWAMDEGFGTTANNSGSRSLPATLTNATFRKNGKVNGSVYFDGSGDVLSASSDQAFDGQDGISFSFWMNPTSLTNSTLPTVYNRGTQSNTVGFHWIFFNASGTLFQYQYANGSSTPGVTLGAPIQTGVWQHIVITHDRLNKIIKTYYNGRLVDTDTYTDSAAAVTAGTPYIAGYLGLATATYAYQGFIDEFKIYDTVISAEQARMDFNGGASLNFGVTTATDSAQMVNGSGNSPVAQWSFNEGTGQFAYDSSGNNATSYVGETSSVESTKDPDWVNGKVGGGLYFDGASNVALVPYVSSLSLGNNLTLQAWIRPTTLAPADQSIINKGTTSSWNNRAYSLMLASDEISISYLNGNGWQQFLTTTANLVANRWYHIAYTRDGTTEKIYLNGYLLEQQAQTESMVDDTFELTIGAMIANSPGNEKFFGTIDEVKLYNYARTPSQVAYDYNRGGPFAYYQFDECEGTAINDASGNDYHGTWFGTSSGSQTAVGTCATSSTAWGNGAVGKINSSLNFDGTNDYVALPDDILDSQTTGSVCTWYYYDVPADVSTQGALFTYSDGASTNNKHIFYISDSGTDSGMIRAVLRNSGSGNQIDYYTANNVITRQTWQHVCFVQDGTGIKLYLNNKLVTLSTTLAGTGTLDDWFDDIGSSAENATIGVIEDDSKDSYFTGKIDDLRIYSYPLSQAQIGKIMQDGSSVKFGPSSGSP